jgi:hypothetical protein
MMKPQRKAPFADPAEPVLMWASSDGTRCLMACLDGTLDLRIEHDGTVIRQARYVEYRPACEAAQQWRVDWDIESWPRRRRGRIRCPECAGELLPERDGQTGVQWFRCGSCGDAWRRDDARLCDAWRFTR